MWMIIIGAIVQLLIFFFERWWNNKHATVTPEMKAEFLREIGRPIHFWMGHRRQHIAALLFDKFESRFNASPPKDGGPLSKADAKVLAEKYAQGLTLEETNMGGKYGVKETIDVLDFIFTGVAIGKDVLKDGKVGIFELAKFVPLIPRAIGAVNGALDVPKEIAELDAEDQAELVAYVATRLPDVTDNAKISAVADAYLQVIVAIANAVRATAA